MREQSKPTGHKQPKKTVFYLDRNLCCARVIEPLRRAGYDLVAYSEEYGVVNNQRVPDPVVIERCGNNKHVLITADRRMEYTYAAEIYAARIGVVLLITNNGGAESWRVRLETAQNAIREQIATRRKPYLIRVAQDGKLTMIRLYRKNTSKTFWIDS